MSNQQLSTNTFTTAKWIVSPTASDGTHTTIAAALTSASAGDTIFIRPGTYTEDLILKDSVNLVAISFGAVGFTNGATIIKGKLTSTATSNNIIGITLQTNSDYVVSVTGAGSVYLLNCEIIADSTPLNITNSSGNIILRDCDIGLNNIAAAFCSITTGTIWCYNSHIQNTASTTATTISGGNVNFYNSVCTAVLATSSSGQISGFNSLFDTSSNNNTTITTAGTGTSSFYQCSFFSGTASTIFAGVGTTINLNECVVSSSNTNAITGAGTVSFSNITFSGTSSLINTTTQTFGYTNLGKWKASGQPCFQAWRNGTTGGVTGDATVYTVIFNAVTAPGFDQNSNFNTGTGTFTAPVTGKYQFNVTIHVNGLAADNTFYEVSLVTTAQTFRFSSQQITQIQTSNEYLATYSILCAMSATDTATVTVQVGGHASKNVAVQGSAGGSSFSGFLVA